MKKMLTILMLLLFTAVNSSGKTNSWKKSLHLATAPLILGSGIYSSVRTLNDTHNGSTRAAAISNLVFLGFQVSGGAVLLIGNDDSPPVMRTIHRIVGIGVIASGLWRSIAGTADDRVSSAARYTSHGHTALAVAPLLLFSF